MAENEVTKIAPEVIQKINDVQNNYAKITASLGQLQVRRIALDKEMAEILNSENQLKSQYVENQQSEKTLLEELNTAYGEGTLDLDKGEFIPRS